MDTSVERMAGTACVAIRFERRLTREQVQEMARIVEEAIGTSDDVRLLLDLGATEEYEPSAFTSLEGAITSARSIGPVTRYAVVDAPAPAKAAIETFEKILPLEGRVFAAGEQARARAWAFALDKS